MQIFTVEFIGEGLYSPTAFRRDSQAQGICLAKDGFISQGFGSTKLDGKNVYVRVLERERHRPIKGSPSH